MIQYVKGDATQPQGPGHKYIIHICNILGGWGAGFVLAVSQKWRKPEMAYRNWFRDQRNFTLGQVQFINVESDITVVNMLAQETIRRTRLDPSAIHLGALNECLEKVLKEVGPNDSIHAPRLGAGLGGAKWEDIEALLMKNLVNNNVPVTIYDLF